MDISHIIEQQVPAHIREDYPNFTGFLKAYYAWLCEEDNVYGRISNHLDYLSFEKTLDDYVDFMQREYLSKLPLEVFGDRQKFIEWSKKLNLSRGSHESYKFLFNIMYGDSTTGIYLPKDNILRPSDGQWVNEKTAILTTNPGNPEDLLYSEIEQRRELAPGIFQTTTGIVERVSVIYQARYNIIEVTLSDVKGEFLEDYPITSSRIENVIWPIKTITDFSILDGGQNYFVNEQINIETLSNTYDRTYEVTQEGILDTRLTTFFNTQDITVYIEGSNISFDDYEYDGQYITSPLLTLGAEVIVTIPSVYSGIVKVNEVDDNGSVLSFKIDSPVIGVEFDEVSLSYDFELEPVIENTYMESGYLVDQTNQYRSDRFINSWINKYEERYYVDSYTVIDVIKSRQDAGLGSGLNVLGLSGLTRRIPGYYINTKGHISSYMFVQDSFYYQDYSYELLSQKILTDYVDVVKSVLHPSGFKLFGRLDYIIESESPTSIIEYNIEQA